MTMAVAVLALSLVAVLLLVAIAAGLGLGEDVRLRDEDEAVALAQAAVCGFHPVEIALDRAGIGALLRDAAGRVMVIKRHGARFSARLVTSHAGTRLDQTLLTVSTGEACFGSVTLDLGRDAQTWAGSLRRLGGGGV